VERCYFTAPEDKSEDRSGEISSEIFKSEWRLESPPEALRSAIQDKLSPINVLQLVVAFTERCQIHGVVLFRSAMAKMF
jgi:hypothetical protein